MGELTYYNSSSGNYKDFIKNTIQEASQKQIMYNTAATSTAAVAISNSIDNASVQIQKELLLNTKVLSALGKTMISSTEVINTTIENGFANLSNELGFISSTMTTGFDSLQNSITHVSEQICSKLDEIHNIVSNPLLTASRELYKRASENSKKGFYEEALEDILGAIEKNKTDYISWYLAGQLYLFGAGEFSNVVNPQKAEEAFFNTTKYLSPDIGKIKEAEKLASEAYYYLAYSRFILANENKINNNDAEYTKYLELSCQASNKAYSFSNKAHEALYNTARCLKFLNRKDESLGIIRQILNSDCLYSLRFLGDSDFADFEDDLQNLINELRIETINIARENILKIKKYPDEYSFLGGQFATTIKEKIDSYSATEISDDIYYIDIVNLNKELTSIIKSMECGEYPCDRLVHKKEVHAEFLVNGSWYKKSVDGVFSCDNIGVYKLLFTDEIKDLGENIKYINNGVNDDESLIEGYKYIYDSLSTEGEIAGVLTNTPREGYDGETFKVFSTFETREYEKLSREEWISIDKQRYEEKLRLNSFNGNYCLFSVLNDNADAITEIAIKGNNNHNYYNELFTEVEFKPYDIAYCFLDKDTLILRQQSEDSERAIFYVFQSGICKKNNDELITEHKKSEEQKQINLQKQYEQDKNNKEASFIIKNQELITEFGKLIVELGLCKELNLTKTSYLRYWDGQIHHSSSFDNNIIETEDAVPIFSKMEDFYNVRYGNYYSLLWYYKNEDPAPKPSNKLIQALYMDEFVRYSDLRRLCITNETIYEMLQKSPIKEHQELKEKIDEIQASLKDNSSGGCYIATSVYGSYNCPEVWVLRRFRDFRLAKSWYGRLFIKTYYFISPKLVKLFGKTKWFNKIWKPKLDNMVKNLKVQGFEDTPYNDPNY